MYTLAVAGFFLIFAVAYNAFAGSYQNDAGWVSWSDNSVSYNVYGYGSGDYSFDYPTTKSASSGGAGAVAAMPSLPSSATTSLGNHIYRTQIFRRAIPQRTSKTTQGCFPVRRQARAGALNRISPAKYTTAPGDERTTGTGVAGSEASPITADDAKPIDKTGISEGPASTPPLPTPLDSDGDGYYNYAEEALGSDPYHAARYPNMPSASANANETARQYYRDQVESGQGNGRLYGADSADGVRTGARTGKTPVEKSGSTDKATVKGLSKGDNTVMPEGSKRESGMTVGVAPAAGSGKGDVGQASELVVGPPVVAPASGVFYINMWEAGGQDGVSIGLNPSAVTQLENGSLMFTVPIMITMPDNGDTAFSIGCDVSFAKSFFRNTVSVGAHVNGIGHILTFEDADGYYDSEFDFSYGGGPFGSYFFQVSEKLGVSLGCLVEFQDHTEGDSNIMVIPGLNVGYALTDTVGLNCYGLLFDNLDNDLVSYTQIGGDISFMAGDGSLSVGAKTTTGLEGFSSFELYVGGQWRY